jgi:hypothetical protein
MGFGAYRPCRDRVRAGCLSAGCYGPSCWRTPLRTRIEVVNIGGNCRGDFQACGPRRFLTRRKARSRSDIHMAERYAECASRPNRRFASGTKWCHGGATLGFFKRLYTSILGVAVPEPRRARNDRGNVGSVGLSCGAIFGGRFQLRQDHQTMVACRSNSIEPSRLGVGNGRKVIRQWKTCGRTGEASLSPI